MTIQRALVTGGAGFIGSHIVDRLVASGCHVTVVDNLERGRRENLNSKAIFHEMDIGSNELLAVFEESRPNVVFHLAARASVAVSVRDPAGDVTKNVLASVNVLDQCRTVGIDRFVFSSTGGALYGDPEHLPCDETHPIRPRSPYGAGKNAVEGYVRSFASMAGFKYSILRYGNVYGPRQDPFGEAGAVAIFTQRMLNDQEVVIFGDGTQQRDFVYVEDVANANILAAEQDDSDVYNVGTARGTDVNSIFHRIASETGYRSEPHYEPGKPGEVFRIYLANDKAAEKLGWRPDVQLEAGIRETVRYFREANLS